MKNDVLFEIEVGDQRQSIVSIFHRRRILGTRIQILSIGGAKSVFNITPPTHGEERAAHPPHQSTTKSPTTQSLVSRSSPHSTIIPNAASPPGLLAMRAPGLTPTKLACHGQFCSPPAGSFVAVLIGAHHACQHEFDVEVAEWRSSQSATPSALGPKESQLQSATANRWINRILAIVVTLLSVVTTDILLAEESSEVFKSCRIFDKLEIFRNQLC